MVATTARSFGLHKTTGIGEAVTATSLTQTVDKHRELYEGGEPTTSCTNPAALQDNVKMSAVQGLIPTRGVGGAGSDPLPSIEAASEARANTTARASPVLDTMGNVVKQRSCVVLVLMFWLLSQEDQEALKLKRNSLIFAWLFYCMYAKCNWTQDNRPLLFAFEVVALESLHTNDLRTPNKRCTRAV